MKKLILVIIAAALFVIDGGSYAIASEPVTPPTNPSKNEDTKEVILNKEYVKNPKKDRDFGADVTAYLNTKTRTLDVYLYDSGETNIYVVNSHNEIIFEGLYDSECFPIASVMLPDEAGRYWVVVSSEYIYAEGLFYK